jgi:hypothetical protein
MTIRAILPVIAVFTCAFASAQEWQVTPKSDPLTGKSYTLYELTGKFLTPPSRGGGTPPLISVRCDPSANHGRISGKLLDGFIVVNTVIDIRNGDATTIQYRLDDGKLQYADQAIGYSTDFQAIHLDNIFVNNMLWGHMIPHKPGKAIRCISLSSACRNILPGKSSCNSICQMHSKSGLRAEPSTSEFPLSALVIFISCRE